MYVRLPSSISQESKRIDTVQDNEMEALFPIPLWTTLIFPYFTLDELANIVRYLPNITLKYLKNDPEQVETLRKYSEIKLRQNFLETQQDVLAQYANRIHQVAKTRRATLQEIEDKRLIKKSTWATLCSLLPTVALVTPSIPKFLAAKSARKIAESLVRSVLYPTCKNTLSDTLSTLTYSVLSIGERVPGFNYPRETCKHWRDNGWWDSGGQHKYGCDYEKCMSTVKFVIDNVQKNDWDGGLLAAVGCATFLAAFYLYCCLNKWEALNRVSLERILAKPIRELVNEDFCETIREYLKTEKTAFSRLTVRQVIEQIRDIRGVVNGEMNKLMTSADMRVLRNTLQSKEDQQAIKADCVINIQLASPKRSVASI